jgi:hypothetical protein
LAAALQQAAARSPADVAAGSVRTLLTVWLTAEDGSLADGAVHHLAYGGGPHVLLAAATSSRLGVFSLEDLISEAFDADTSSSAVGAGGALAAGGGGRGWGSYFCAGRSGGASLVGAAECGAAARVLAISWTQQLDGVLVSTADGGVAMWQLRPVGGGGDTPHAAARLRRAWAAAAAEPQDALSAGVGAFAPSASVSTAGDRCASVWWPDSPAASGGGGGGGGARREKLKHPCALTSLAWCPGVLRKDIFAGGLDAGASGGGSPPPPQQAGGGAAAAAGGGRAPEDHPALMTVGVDGGVRVWVEMLVVHHPAAEPAAAASPGKPPTAAAAAAAAAASDPQAAQLDSYFAMALVVEPPPEHAQQAQPGAPLVALWGRSVGSMLGRSQAATASGTVLWLLTAAPGGAGAGGGLAVRLYAVRGLSAVVVASFAGTMSGASSLTAGSKRPQAVLWGQHSWAGLPPAAAGGPAHPPTLLSGGSPRLQSTLSAWITSEESFPDVHLFAAACRPPAGAAAAAWLDAAGVTYATVLEEGRGALSPRALPQRLAARSSWRAAAVAHAADVAALRAAPGDAAPPLLASADRRGDVVVWEGAGMQPLASLPGAIPPAAARGGECIEWLPRARDAGAGAGAELLAVCSSGGGGGGGAQVAVYRVRRDARDAELAAALALPGAPTALHALPGGGGSGGAAQQLAAVCPEGDGGPGSATVVCLVEVTTGGGGGGGVELRLAGAAPLPAGVGPVVASAGAAALPGVLLLGDVRGRVHIVTLEQCPAEGQRPSGARLAVVSTLEVPGAAPPAALAFAPETGHVAAATAGDAPALFIWRLDLESPFPAAAAAAAAPPAAALPLPAPAAAVAWLPGLAAPCLAVGGPQGGVTLWAPSRGGGAAWRHVAALPGRPGLGPVQRVAAGGGGWVVAAAGPRLVALSLEVATDHELKPLGRWARRLLCHAALPLGCCGGRGARRSGRRSGRGGKKNVPAGCVGIQEYVLDMRGMGWQLTFDFLPLCPQAPGRPGGPAAAVPPLGTARPAGGGARRRRGRRAARARRLAAGAAGARGAVRGRRGNAGALPRRLLPGQRRGAAVAKGGRRRGAAAAVPGGPPGRAPGSRAGRPASGAGPEWGRQQQQQQQQRRRCCGAAAAAGAGGPGAGVGGARLCGVWRAAAGLARAPPAAAAAAAADACFPAG